MSEGSGEEMMCFECGYETLRFDDGQPLVCPSCHRVEIELVDEIGMAEPEEVVVAEGPVMSPKSKVFGNV